MSRDFLRPQWHLTAPAGRLNDPNGLFLSGDKLHVFYQHDPVFPTRPKRTGWGHATIDLGGDLIPRHLPDALYPHLPYDLDGCYSGCAVPQNEGVRLFYTGNVKVNGERYTSQNQVHLSDPDGPHGGIFRPDPANPLIDGPAPGFTAHFRDPHVTCDEQGWRMVIGAQNDALEGQVVLYRSQDLDSWEFQGPLNFDRPAPRGYMYECPNLLTMTDKQTGEQRDILVICPQSDVDTCVYAVGLLDGTSFHIETDFAPLDFGHEFYAPHLVARDGRALMMAWMGLPGRDEAPTEGWVHCLTAVRELVLENGRIKQEILFPEQALQRRVDLANEERVLTVFDSHGNPGPRVHYEPEKGTLTLSREGDIRSMACGSGELHLTVDGCAVELTAEDGLVAAASMAYGDWTEITEERL